MLGCEITEKDEHTFNKGNYYVLIDRLNWQGERDRKRKGSKRAIREYSGAWLWDNREGWAHIQ